MARSSTFVSGVLLLASMATPASARAQAVAAPSVSKDQRTPTEAAPVLATPPASAPIVAFAPAPPPLDAVIDPEIPLAGYHNGSFYIRSQDDVFRLYVLGRVHSDWSDQFGAGTGQLSPNSGINNGFFLRRARLEMGGELFKTWQWQVGAEFSSSTSIDNAAATQDTPTCTVNAATGAQTCTNVSSAVDNATVKPIPTDVFVNYGPSPFANLEVGQFYLPFTLENRISDNTTPFLERSVAVRDLGAPLQRDIGAMFWGESPDRMFYYTVALLNGDGQNRPNVDSRYDVAGHVFVRPLAISTSSPTRWMQIGISARDGSRDPSKVGYDLPSMTTQEGFAFWKPTYKDSLGRTIHIMPSATQWALAADLYLPIEKFDFTGEFIYAVDDTREAVDGYQLSPFTERLGQLKGFAWYAEAGYWLVGDHDIIGHPSYGRPVHLDLKKPQNPHQYGLQVLAKFEQLHLTYEGNSRGGSLNANTPDGEILVDTLEFGINYWATKHLRVGINYGWYLFPGSEPVSASTKGGPSQSASQRAVAPAQNLAKGVDDTARNSAHTLNEVSARLGVQF